MQCFDIHVFICMYMYDNIALRHWYVHEIECNDFVVDTRQWVSQVRQLLVLFLMSIVNEYNHINKLCF